MAQPSAHSDLHTMQKAGWALLGGSALVLVAIIIYVSGGENELVLACGLLVTLFGLIAFADPLGEGGELEIPRFGIATFAMGLTCWIVSDALDDATFELESAYTLLASATIALYGWSILRTHALPRAIGWFSIGWGALYGIGYASGRISPPLGPNLAILIFGAALVWYSRRSDGAGELPT